MLLRLHKMNGPVLVLPPAQKTRWHHGGKQRLVVDFK